MSIMSGGSVARTVRLFLINSVLALLLLEGILQVVSAIGHGNTNPIVKKIYWYIKPHMSWEEWFLISYMDKGNMIYAGIHQHHPTRGWAMRPSACFQANPNVTYTTNKQGYRALYDYADQRDKYEVLVLGDSFTFGDEVNDTDTWPQVLQNASPHLNVLNMAGTGYGTDQMLITLEEEIGKYHPDLVIAAYIDDNLQRSLLPFRDYKKPVFDSDENGLSLTNAPIGDPRSVIEEISHKRYWSYGYIKTLNLVDFFFNDLNRMETGSDCRGKCRTINIAIFQKISAIARQRGAEFMLVYLPRGNEIQTLATDSYGEKFLQEFSEGDKFYVFDPRASFVAADFAKSSEHYHRNEDALLGALLMEQITKTGSWQCKVEKRCSP